MPARTQPPAYYARVAAKAQATCQLLDDQPDLSGAWELLFEQIQNPRFVISELLQNADDAGATEATVTLSDNEFVFSHNGQDFNEDQFASLCRFGFSNKRTIHTIGFRGIGFKSTFSLGDAVEVWTPTLGVSFPVKRFIEPHWIHDGRHVTNTQIRIRITNPGAHKDLKESLEHWTQSPASLLFFNNILRLTLNGLSIERAETKTSVPHTFAVELSGATKQSLYLVRSDEEPFPQEAIEEIRKARRLKDISDLHLGGCEVEVVLGLTGDQHLFVVLPTGEPLALPFSVNAPFLLKPDRFDIKPPSTSPTNKWLLERAGRLVADVVLAWLGNESLSLKKRIEAYRFLPDPQLLGASVGSLLIRETVVGRLINQPVIIDCYEKLCVTGATSVPAPLFDIWSRKQVRSMFAPDAHLLSPEVTLKARLALEKLGWIQHVTAETVLTRMSEAGVLPMPDGWSKLALLWQFVLEHQPKYDFDNSRKRSIPIIPVAGQEDLRPAASVVRVSTRTESLSAETIEWLTGRTKVLDLRWPDWISKQEAHPRDALLALLKALQLHEPTPVNRLVEQTASAVFARDKVALDECVQLAQLFAALGANTPKGFQFVTRDMHRRTIDQGLVYDMAGSVADLSPDSWAKAHILHASYDQFVRCTQADWIKWLRSPAAGLRQSFPLKPRADQFRSRFGLVSFLTARNSAEPTAYHYKSSNFEVQDFALDQELVSHWTTLSKKDASVWQKALSQILSDSPHCWQGALVPSAYQEGSQYTRALACPPITPQWITIFRDKGCLLDTHQQLHQPSELYRRTPDTDPLQSSREFRFVNADLDVEAVRPVLRLLGVMDTPADYKKIIKRLGDLHSVPVSPVILTTVSTLYQVLDRIVARCTPTDRVEIESLFAKKPLVLAADQTWQTSGELSVFPGDEETPDEATYVHPAFQGLSMWARVGISQHPSVAQSIDWLHTLASGQKLDGSAYKRVRRVLSRDSLRVWQECSHWLSLDATWEPTGRFTHRLAKQTSAQPAQLMPGVRQVVADLRPVASHLLAQSPFVGLIELADALETRVTRFVPSHQPQLNPQWVEPLAETFRRIKLSDSDRQARVRAAGERLMRTRWRVARELEITPYLGQTPAGSSSSAKVAWVAHDLYLLGGPAGRLHRTLVEELGAPFDHPDIARAFDSCAGRDPNFIADYLAEHFTVEEIAELPGTGSEPSTPNPTDESAGSASGEASVAMPGEESPSETVPPTVADGPANSPEEEGEKEQQSVPPKPRAAHEPSVFDRYAASLGFRFSGNGYNHPDGRLIVKSEAPFHWQLIDARGSSVRRYWSSRETLEKGVEVTAELWTLTHQSPGSITWVMLSEDRGVVAINGNDLSAKTAAAELKLYPASYRLLSTDSEA